MISWTNAQSLYFQSGKMFNCSNKITNASGQLVSRFQAFYRSLFPSLHHFYDWLTVVQHIAATARYWISRTNDRPCSVLDPIRVNKRALTIFLEVARLWQMNNMSYH